MDQLGSASTLKEGKSCDGGGIDRDGHIRATTTGRTAAVRSIYRQIYTNMYMLNT
jgi:hypothetical protein